MKKIALILSLALIASGCSMIQPKAKPVSVTTIAKQQPMYHPPLPMEVQMDPVDWEILTPDSIQLYLDNLKKGEAPRRAFYSLSSKEYENLSMDIADITRYITEVLGIIRFYRDYDKEEEEEEPSKRRKQ
jgi:PBP1b-binding outer membrane lipoprotein LpoB